MVNVTMEYNDAGCTGHPQGARRAVWKDVKRLLKRGGELKEGEQRCAEKRPGAEARGEAFLEHGS